VHVKLFYHIVSYHVTGSVPMDVGHLLLLTHTVWNSFPEERGHARSGGFWWQL